MAKNKDRQNDKRRILYYLDHHGLGWVAKIIKKALKGRKV